MVIPGHVRAAAFLITICIIGLGTCTAGAAPVIIAHVSVPADTLESGMVQKIFLGKLTEWDKELPIVPVVLTGGSVTDTFLRTYVRKSPSQFSVFWRKAVFTGTGTPPRAFKGVPALISHVSQTAGAIGYVDSENELPDEGIKILTVRQE